MRPPAGISESGPGPQSGGRRKRATTVLTHQPGAPSGHAGRSAWLIYLAFFASGVSGLIYQVVWVRAFGNVFGNTIQSASLVVAVFMLGLGVGSHLVGRWADRRYARDPGSLLRAYGQAELAIALLGLVVSLTLPHLGPLGALLSSYAQGAGRLVRSVIDVVSHTPGSWCGVAAPHHRPHGWHAHAADSPSGPT